MALAVCVCASNLLCLVVLGAVVDHPVLLDRPGWVGPVELHLPGAQVGEAQVCGSRVGEGGVGGGPWAGSCGGGERETEINSLAKCQRSKVRVRGVTFGDATFLDPPAQDVHQPGHQLAEQREVVDVVDVEVQWLRRHLPQLSLVGVLHTWATSETAAARQLQDV